MGRVDHLGIVGAGQEAAGLAALVDAAGYRVCRLDDFVASPSRAVEGLPWRLDALCLCVTTPPEVYRAIAGYLRLAPGVRPAYLLNMTTIGPGHARKIDRLLGRLAPKTVFAECQFTGDALALRRHEATILYGSSYGPPGEALAELLGALAARVIDLGDVAKASAGKLVSSAAAVSIALATLEALKLGRESGLPVGSLLEVMSSGTGDSSVLRRCLAPALLDGDPEADLRLALAREDTRLVLALAGEKGSPAAHAALAARLLEGDAADAVAAVGER